MNDEPHAANTLYHLGTVAWSTGLNDQAIGFHRQAVEICERTGLADLVAVQAYHGRGEAYFANAEPVAAITCYTRSLDLARAIGDKSYECENLMMIGHACVGTKGLGNYPRATTNLEAALEIARLADLQWYLLLDLGLNDLAVDQLEQGLAIAQDTGIMFWRATIDAHVAVARSRLGQKDVALGLHSTLEQTRRTSERYLMVRCIDGLAEIALAAGDADRCRAYGDELLAIAEPNGLREIEAAARRWRGEALFAEKAYEEAHVELSRAAALAENIGRVRLQMDTESALARLLEAQGASDVAQRHAANARGIAEGVKKSLISSGLEMPLRMTGDAR
jgi:tetratricopeptide (TPR) repeat protein